jgi:cytochrome c peroxidase
MKNVKKIMTMASLALVVLLLTYCQPNSTTGSGPSPIGTPFQLDVPQGFPQPFIPADNPMTEEGVKLGRHLFYETALSGDNSMNCASCHMQERAFTDASAVSVGIDGIPGTRKAMPLFNLAFVDKFFWDGRSVSLEEQAIIPIIDPIELNADMPTVVKRLQDNPLYPPMFAAAFGDDQVTPERMGKAIAQFERTLISANSKFDSVERLKTGARFSPEEQLGFEMFTTELGDCFHCHGTVETNFLLGAFGVDLFINNGLKDNYTDKGRFEVTGNVDDIGKFKVPSVRNVQFAFPYMHDGSVPNLDSLIGFYNFGGHKHINIDPNMKAAGIGRNWTSAQKQGLAAFLRSLSDYQFLTDTAFSDPFEQ